MAVQRCLTDAMRKGCKELGRSLATPSRHSRREQAGDVTWGFATRHPGKATQDFVAGRPSKATQGFAAGHRVKPPRTSWPQPSVHPHAGDREATEGAVPAEPRHSAELQAKKRLLLFQITEVLGGFTWAHNASLRTRQVTDPCPLLHQPHVGRSGPRRRHAHRTRQRRRHGHRATDRPLLTEPLLVGTRRSHANSVNLQRRLWNTAQPLFDVYSPPGKPNHLLSSVSCPVF